MTASFNHEPAWSVGAGISSKRESGGWATPDREYICEVQRGSAGVFVRASPTEFSLRWRSQKLGGPIYPSPLRLRGRRGRISPRRPQLLHLQEARSMRGIPHAHTERWPPDASPERSGPARRGSGDGAGSGPHEMPVDRRATGPMSVVADGVAADDVSGQLTSDVQRDLVKDVQRIWILSAMAKIACERGPESVTVREIVGR